MKYKWHIVVGLVCLGIGRFSLPAKVVEKTVTITKIVEVEKKQTEEDKVKHVDKVYHKVVRSDGTQDITITDKTIDNDNKTTVDTKSSETDSTKTKEKTVTYSSSSTFIKVLGAVNVSDPAGIMYGLGIEKRLLGPVTFGTFGLFGRNVIIGGTLGLVF